MEQRYGFCYKLKTAPTSVEGKPLPVSRGQVHGIGHQYITIPWNAVDDQTPDPRNPVSLNNGWTFLYGPFTEAMVFAHVRLTVVQAKCSTHLRLYAVDAQDNRIYQSESPEHFVGENEEHIDPVTGVYTSSATHCHGSWRIGALPAGARLRIEVDYWNAREERYLTGRINGARIQGVYWRELPPEPEPTPAPPAGLRIAPRS